MDINEDSLDASMYDFTPDEFDNQKEFKEKRRKEAEHKKMMEDCIQLLGSAFDAKLSSHKNLKNFLIHDHSLYPFIVESYEGISKNKEFYCCILVYTGDEINRHIYFYGEPKYFSGLITLKTKYPHTIIQPETLAHKFENLFTKNDVDFKHSKKFSGIFHVITKNKDALQILWHNKDLNKLASFSQAQIEINERHCYFRVSEKPISLDETSNFIELAKTLMEIL